MFTACSSAIFACISKSANKRDNTHMCAVVSRLPPRRLICSASVYNFRPSLTFDPWISPRDG